MFLKICLIKRKNITFAENFNTRNGMNKDISTEEKIKAAALQLFYKKGYAGTKTRDIADEAGINIALLNYYFRSKEKLFEIIMEETLHRIFRGVSALFDRKDLSIMEKLEGIACSYIDSLAENPNLPLFVLSEIQADATGFVKKNAFIQNFFKDKFGMDSAFMQEIKTEFNVDNPLQIVINLVALSVFPFVARPMFAILTNMNEEEMKQFMENRKKLIPKWIKCMLES